MANGNAQNRCSVQWEPFQLGRLGRCVHPPPLLDRLHPHGRRADSTKPPTSVAATDTTAGTVRRRSASSSPALWEPPPRPRPKPPPWPPPTRPTPPPPPGRHTTADRPPSRRLLGAAGRTRGQGGDRPRPLAARREGSVAHGVTGRTASMARGSCNRSKSNSAAHQLMALHVTGTSVRQH